MPGDNFSGLISDFECHLRLHQHSLEGSRMENSRRAEGTVQAAESKVCRRCKEEYDPSSNTSSSCRFHPSFFVCRRHDDQKRYYELGPNDPPYDAKFYDCCGAEDPDAPGCATDHHLSYDD